MLMQTDMNQVHDVTCFSLFHFPFHATVLPLPCDSFTETKGNKTPFHASFPSFFPPVAMKSRTRCHTSGDILLTRIGFPVS